MTSERLPTALEAAGLVRSVEAQGGYAAVLRRGDAERGALILFISSRGLPVARLERILGLDGEYQWVQAAADEGESAKVAKFLAKRARFDADFWALELDVADPQRFIAEILG